MEGLLRLAARRHGLGEVGRNGYLPLLIVSLDLDINEITHVDAQLPPDTAVHEEAVLPPPRGARLERNFWPPTVPLTRM